MPCLMQNRNQRNENFVTLRGRGTLVCVYSSQIIMVFPKIYVHSCFYIDMDTTFILDLRKLAEEL